MALRRPKFESLENRWLMAADLGQISGAVLSELQNDSNAANNVAASGVTVQLYRDNGDGVFSASGDTLRQSVLTSATGAYSFTGVTEGGYFVRAIPASGQQAASGGDVSGLITFSAAEAAGSTNLTVDTFQGAQSTSVTKFRSDPPIVASTSADGVNNSIGGPRDLYAQISGANGTMELESGFLGSALLNLQSSSAARGVARVVWDGPDGDGVNVARNGLSLDFNNGGVNTGILLAVSADNKPNATVTVRLSSSASQVSTATVAIADQDGQIDGDATESIFIPWSSFSPASGTASGVNLADVGSVELEFDFSNGQSDGLDVVATLVGVIGRTVKTANFTVAPTLSLGNQVWIDSNNDGMFMAPEVGVANVTVDLYRDTNRNNQFDPGVDQFVATTTTSAGGQYNFGNLQAGDYVVNIPESMFAAGAPLAGLSSSTGNNVGGMAPDPDVDTDSKDKGDPIAGAGVASKAVTLLGQAEPITEDQNPNSNLTVDFGFFGLDVQVTKTVSAATASIGAPLSYTVVVRNNGPATATGVTVVDTLPAGVTYRATGSTPTPTSVVGQTVTYALGTFAPGQTKTLLIAATIGSSATGTLTNTVTVTANERETTLENNSDVAVTTLNPPVTPVGVPTRPTAIPPTFNKRRFLASSL